MTTVDGLIHSPLFGPLREYLAGGDTGAETTFLFVPYARADVAAKLLDGIRNRVVVVTTWNPADLASGSSDAGLYPFCRERGYALYVSQDLHLKAYSVGLGDAVLATGNVSRRGLLPGGNYEAAVRVVLGPSDRLFLEQIRRGARLVDDAVYGAVMGWLEDNRAEPAEVRSLEDIAPRPDADDFLISALPMTRSVGDLAAGYARMAAGRQPSDDPETAACIFHDLANYGVPPGLDGDGFLRELSSKFFAHPFIRRIDGFIDPEAYFGRIKEWVQDNCADVPVPSRRELTGNVQVLLEWFVALGGGRYEVDVPGRRSQRIRRL